VSVHCGRGAKCPEKNTHAIHTAGRVYSIVLYHNVVIVSHCHTILTSTQSVTSKIRRTAYYVTEEHLQPRKFMWQRVYINIEL